MKFFKTKILGGEKALNSKIDDSSSRQQKTGLWQRCEAFGMICVVFGFFCVVGSQIIISQAKWQEKLNISTSFYGEEYQPAVVVDALDEAMTGNVTIELEGYTTLPEAVLLINGKEIQNFASNQLTIKVASGDVIEVDSSAYQLTVTFKLVKASSNINTAFLQKKLAVQRGRAVFGKVLFK